MSYDLCLQEQAGKPYFIENIRTDIYSLEELCFYLYNNMCLIDSSIVNEKLCDWLRDELHLTRLYRQLMEQLGRIESDHSPENTQNIVYFVMPIFREAGYLDGSEMRRFQDEFLKLNVQPDEMKQKLRGDYLVKEKMFARAVSEYRQILKKRSPGRLGTQFYASVWNNLGAAYAGLFRFEDAAECFLESWHLMRTKESFRKYISALPMFLSREEYAVKLEEIQADAEMADSIQEYNAELCKNPELISCIEEAKKRPAEKTAEELKEQFCKSTRT